MLPRIVRLKPGLPGRSRVILALFGLSLLAIPTLHQNAQSQEEPSVQAEATAVTKPSVKASTKPMPSDTTNGSSEKARTLRATVEPITLPEGSTIRFDEVQGVVRRGKLPVMAPPAVEYYPEISETEKKILTALSSTFELSVEDESLEGVMSLITDKQQKEHQFNVVIDRKALEGESVVPDAKDISLSVKGVSLRSWLRLVLEPKALAIVIEDEVVKVTTVQVAQYKKLTRTYPVRDLVGNVDADYLLLKKAIQEASREHSWATEFGGGGEGTISILPATGCLVISQTWQAHEDILTLLRALRSANQEIQPR